MKTIYDFLGRAPVHPFPARMAPNIAVDVLEVIGDAKRVLDPMMGSGTVLALARALQHRAVGIDLDPLAVLISRVWTTAIDQDDVRQAAVLVLDSARQRFSDMAVRDAYPATTDAETRAFIRYWFDPYARRQLTALSSAIQTIGDLVVRDVLWCAFSRLIIAKQYGASLAMDLSHSRPHKTFRTAPAKPFARFSAVVEKVIVNCIDRNQRGRGPATDVREGDARHISLPDKSIDVVLTSPPYLNAIDYMRCSKFSLVWMGYSLPVLRGLRSVSVGTEVGSRNDGTQLSRRIVARLKLQPELGTRDRRILLRYIDDMDAAVREVSRVLVRGGHAVYVVGENTIRGTYIQNSEILSALAVECGLRRLSSRTRALPASRRYLPPPTATTAASFDARMRREVVLTFAK